MSELQTEPWMDPQMGMWNRADSFISLLGTPQLRDVRRDSAGRVLLTWTWNGDMQPCCSRTKAHCKFRRFWRHVCLCQESDMHRSCLIKLVQYGTVSLVYKDTYQMWKKVYISGKIHYLAWKCYLNGIWNNIHSHSRRGQTGRPCELQKFEAAQKK